MKIRASNRNPAVSSATMPTSAMYFSLAGVAMWDSELEKMAAVAESAATTRWREEPKTRERNQRQQHGVESGDDGRAGDAGVAEHLRDVHRRERHARQSIAPSLAGLKRPKAPKEPQPHSHAPPVYQPPHYDGQYSHSNYNRATPTR